MVPADVVLWPDRSIIKQSYDARERIMDTSLPSHLAHGNLNGDGFGIGWHNGSMDPPDPTPCVFTSVTPAWSVVPLTLFCVTCSRFPFLDIVNCSFDRGATLFHGYSFLQPSVCGGSKGSNMYEDALQCYGVSCRNNDNLGRLASKIVSPIVFAHVRGLPFLHCIFPSNHVIIYCCSKFSLFFLQVRAAMPGMPVSEQNCHPFQWGRFLW